MEAKPQTGHDEFGFLVTVAFTSAILASFVEHKVLQDAIGATVAFQIELAVFTGIPIMILAAMLLLNRVGRLKTPVKIPAEGLGPRFRVMQLFAAWIFAAFVRWETDQHAVVPTGWKLSSNPILKEKSIVVAIIAIILSAGLIARGSESASNRHQGVLYDKAYNTLSLLTLLPKPNPKKLRKVDVLTASASQLSKWLRNRDIRATVLVDLFIQRQMQTGYILNAVVKDRYELARAEAIEADQRLDKAATRTRGRQAELPMFTGVPCTVKESMGVNGMPQTSGLASREGVLATKDSATVERLRSAGFIILGVTNMSELCMWWETENTVYGRTNNPYDTDRMVGGSSGGEGCIVSAMGSPLGLGADIGGSIRLPAFYCGIFGHKATSGLVPNVGQYPDAEGMGRELLCSGILARHSQDLWPTLQILSGPHKDDEFCHRKLPGPTPEEVDVNNLRVYYMDWAPGPTILVPAPTMELQSAVQRAAQALCEGHKEITGPLRLPRCETFSDALMIWSSMMDSTGVRTFKDRSFEGKSWPGLRAFGHLIRMILGLYTPFTLPAIMLCCFEAFNGLFPSMNKSFIAKGRKLREELDVLLGSDGVLVCISQPQVAPFHDEPKRLKYLCSFVYTAIYNALGLPVTQVPVGLNREGVPLGVQIVAATGQDHLSIAAATKLEKKLGGWQLPYVTSSR